MVSKRIIQLLLVAATAYHVVGSESADARAFSSGKTLGNSLTVIGRTPRLDQQTLAGLDHALTRDARPLSAVAQERAAGDAIIRDIEAKGFRNVSGLMRRGDNYVFQAIDPSGMKVRVVMNAASGEIVGFSRIMPKKK